MTMYELRSRDGSWPPLALDGRPGGLAEVLSLAAKMDGWADVYADGVYLITSGWYWWPDDHGTMHQIGSHGWCHDCHKNDFGYVHHLDYDTELAVLTFENTHDKVSRRQCEADGLTPAQAAAEVAGRAVPLDGDHSFATGETSLGTDAAGLAVFAVEMWDMTTWRVAVELAPGAPDVARRLAEQLAYDAQPKRCYDCQGRDRHASDCGTVVIAELLRMSDQLST